MGYKMMDFLSPVHHPERYSPLLEHTFTGVRQADNLFLGLDLSTQSLKVSVISDSLETLWEESVNFDRDLPEFGTKSGVHTSPSGRSVRQPIPLLLHALDLIFTRLQSLSFPFSRVKSISGAAQQHAVVFQTPALCSALAALDPSRPLAEQLGEECFAMGSCHNWQDSSTTLECRELEDAVGGTEEMARRTGSRVHERFSASQIMKVRKEQPEVYAATSRISLLSTFLLILFLCAPAPADESDTSGMNLWSLSPDSPPGWDEEILDVVSGGDAVGLAAKLGEVERDAGKVVGTVGEWWRVRWGFDPSCILCPFTGDNPATFLAFSLAQSEAIVSLGTSDTILVSTSAYAPRAEGHVFAHPAHIPASPDAPTQEWMGMMCHKNGGLSREFVRDTYASSSWPTFNELALEHTPALSSPSSFSFHFLKPEIVPFGATGVHTFVSSLPTPTLPSPELYPSSILESQFLSFRARCAALLPGDNVKNIYAVGGAAKNDALVKRLASVMDAPVWTPSGAASHSACSVGAALKARWAYLRHVSTWTSGGTAAPLTFEESVAQAPSAKRATLVASPDPKAASAYGHVLPEYLRLEDEVLAASSIVPA